MTDNLITPDALASHDTLQASTNDLLHRLDQAVDPRSVWADANALINATLNRLGADLHPLEDVIEHEAWRDFRNNAYALIDTLMIANEALASSDQTAVTTAFRDFSRLLSDYVAHLRTAAD